MPLSYIEDVHLVSAAEAAYTALIKCFDADKALAYNLAVAGWSGKRTYRPWLLHSFEAWVVDSTGATLQGVPILLFQALSQSNVGFQDIGRGWQGLGQRVKALFPRPLRVDYGIAWGLPTPALYLNGAGGDFVYCRAAYEVVR